MTRIGLGIEGEGRRTIIKGSSQVCSVTRDRTHTWADSHQLHISPTPPPPHFLWITDQTVKYRLKSKIRLQLSSERIHERDEYLTVFALSTLSKCSHFCISRFYYGSSAEVVTGRLMPLHLEHLIELAQGAVRWHRLRLVCVPLDGAQAMSSDV